MNAWIKRTGERWRRSQLQSAEMAGVVCFTATFHRFYDGLDKERGESEN